MKIETHINAVRESIDTLKDCLSKGIENRQRTIGFHCSAAAVDLVEIYLHQQNLIDIGLYLKHNWFASIKSASKHIPEFPQKSEILQILHEIERKRNLLCYGKPQPIQTIEETLVLFNKLKARLEALGVKV